MDVLRERLEELADHAPTGGVPGAELWARGKRVQRLRAGGLAVVLLLVGAGAGVGVRLAEGSSKRLTPASIAGITLPIQYPTGQPLPDLGRSPGRLAAVWLAPHEPYTLADDDPGRAPEVVGLVAETGTFGTLPIDLSPSVYEGPDAHFSLSPDGSRIAYVVDAGGPGKADEGRGWELVVLDLVSGDERPIAFDFGVRAGAVWIDATRLVGRVFPGTDADGWLWEPGSKPRRVNPYPYLEGTWAESPYFVHGGDDAPAGSCASPTISGSEGRKSRSVLCDVRDVIRSEMLIGHWSSDDPSEAGTGLERAVIALDIRDEADFPFDDPALRRVVVRPGAPYPVSFATELLREVLDVDGRAS
jgi:hypothetical protein